MKLKKGFPVLKFQILRFQLMRFILSQQKRNWFILRNGFSPKKETIYYKFMQWNKKKLISMENQLRENEVKTTVDGYIKECVGFSLYIRISNLQ